MRVGGKSRVLAYNLLSVLDYLIITIDPVDTSLSAVPYFFLRLPWVLCGCHVLGRTRSSFALPCFLEIHPSSSFQSTFVSSVTKPHIAFIAFTAFVSFSVKGIAYLLPRLDVFCSLRLINASLLRLFPRESWSVASSHSKDRSDNLNLPISIFKSVAHF